MDYLKYLCQVIFRFTFTAVGMLCGIHWTSHGSLRVKEMIKNVTPVPGTWFVIFFGHYVWFLKNNGHTWAPMGIFLESAMF